MSEERNLSQQLADAGFGHRPCRIVNKREVFRASDGEVMGQFDAFEAYYWLTRTILKTHPPAVVE